MNQKDLRQEEQGWQRMRWLDSIIRLNGREFEQTPRDSEGQRRLVCCSLWVSKSQIWLSNWTTATVTITTDLSGGHLPIWHLMKGLMDDHDGQISLYPSFRGSSVSCFACWVCFSLENRAREGSILIIFYFHTIACICFLMASLQTSFSLPCPLSM